MTELVSVVEEDPDGGYSARSVGESTFTEADSIDELRATIREAVACHCDEPEDRPKLIRLHVTRDEVFAL